MKWIKCSQELPPNYQYVLVFASSSAGGFSTLSIARCEIDAWRFLNESSDNATACGDLTWTMLSSEITHWMELPEAPNEVD